METQRGNKIRRKAKAEPRLLNSVSRVSLLWVFSKDDPGVGGRERNWADGSWGLRHSPGTRALHQAGARCGSTEAQDEVSGESSSPRPKSGLSSEKKALHPPAFLSPALLNCLVLCLLACLCEVRALKPVPSQASVLELKHVYEFFLGLPNLTNENIVIHYLWISDKLSF